MRSKLFGDRAFYRMVLGVSLPIMVQNAFTNFVSLLDNIMVGRLGTEPMSGVAIVNQLMFVYNLCIFGALSGAGIFAAQYYGSRNAEGVRRTFRYKLWLGCLLCAAAILILLTGGGALISTYLHGSSDGGDLAAAFIYGQQYLRLMLWGLPPFMAAQVYSGTLRECGETLAPMRAGVAAVLINLVFNYLLIYGHLGFPAMGVEGAALATVISRYAEAALVIVWAHSKADHAPYLAGVYRTLRIPAESVRQFTLKGLPLLLNEALWSSGMAALMQCYSVRGLSVVAGMNISNTVCNLFNVTFMALGTAVSIVVGQQLGAGDLRRAKETDTRMIVFSVLCSVGVAVIVAAGAPFFPLLYNVDEGSRRLATQFILVAAAYMPSIAFLHACYFTVRAGGKTMVTFLYDCGYMVTVTLPLAVVLSRFTALPALWLYICVEATNIVKAAIGLVLVRKDIWLNHIVE